MSESKLNSNAAEWVDALAAFLQESSRVEAIRVDADHSKVSIATLGEVDMPELQARLEATINLIEQQPRGKAIGVFVESAADGSLELSKATCLTAPKLWRWR